MDERDIARIVRFVRALCPAQKIDEYTPDAWELVLDDIAFADARQALKVLGGKLRFIAPSDIAEEVRRDHAARPTFPPGAGPEALEAEIAAVDGPADVAGYLRALRAARRRVAGPPIAAGAVVERTYVHIESKWSRSAIPAAPAPLTTEAAPAPADNIPAYTEAYRQLVADGIPEPTDDQVRHRLALA